jgi:hypothetical protein
MKDHLALTLLVIFILATTLGRATIHYVHPDSSLHTIQAAVNVCAPHDTVLVAPGTYNENISWPFTEGIDLISEHGPDSTIIDGRGDSTVIDIFSCQGFRNTIISGFTIENGATNWSGGGIRTFKSDVVILDNHIAGNSAQWRGAGLYLELSSVEVTGNVIEQNSALIGAGLCATGYGSIIRDNIIRNNTADSLGGGIHASYENITIRDNLITQNTAQYGGGIFLSAPSWWATSLITSNNITNNDASTLGGGIYCEDIGNTQLNILLNNIEDNLDYGLYNEDTVTIDAEYNWWGDASGPYHPVLNPAGLGDSVSDYVDFIPWSQNPVGIEEEPLVKPVTNGEILHATIISGPLQLPSDKKYQVFDIAGRVISPGQMKPGIYFIAIDNKIIKKIVKVR